MKIVFFGTPHFVLPVLQVLTEDFEVVAVVTTPDEKVGRKQVVTPSPVKNYAQNFTHVKQIFSPKEFNAETIQQLIDLGADIFVTAAYGKILPQQVLNIPAKGSLNIHPSLLPKYRGPSPIQTTILHGDTQTGVAYLLMDKEIDHGPLLKTIPYTLKGDETFDSLALTLFSESAKHISEVLNTYASGTLKPTEQDHDQATFTQHITKQDGFVDAQNPPSKEQVDRMIRAYYPWPGAWTTINNQRIKLFPNKMVQLEGKNAVDLETFTRAYPESGNIVKNLLK